eukprot:gene10356-2491_t
MAMVFAVVVLAKSAHGRDHHLENLQDSSYVAEAIISLPYAAISEPIKVYFDAIGRRSRTEYYHGMDVYVYREDLGKHGYQFQINPVTDNEHKNIMTCFGNNGTREDPITIQSLLPDLSKYTVGEKRNNYSFYLSNATGLPIGFEMRGYDDLLGSHYDAYDIYFYDFVLKVPANISLYEPPTGMTCGDFPGADTHFTSVFQTNNNNDIKQKNLGPGATRYHKRGGLHMHEDQSASENEIQELFEEFKVKHGRLYDNDKEHAFRLYNFRHNKRYIDTMNRRRLGYTLATNHLADMHEHELKRLRGSFSSRDDYQYQPETPSAMRSPSRNWRLTGAVTPVKDQGICGSCWSFGAAEAIEGQYFLKTNRSVPMSQQALMDCSWGFGNNACDGGEAFRAYEWVLKNGYIPTEASYGPYLMADGFCHVEQADRGSALKGYVNITSGDMNAVLDALDKQGPLAVAIDASLKSFSFYSSGVYYDDHCGNCPDDLDHVVLAVGYGTTDEGEPYWIIKNSWSTHYGDEGYVYISRRSNNCGVATDAHLPLL